MTKRNRSRSTFARYVLSYVMLLVLVIAGLFGYMYYYVDGEVRSQTIDSQINRLTRIAYQHESQLNSMLNTAEQIGLSPFIEPFRYRDEPWRAYELMRQLVPYTVTNDFCEQIYLTFSEDDYLYTSSSSITLSQFADMVRYERVGEDELLSLLREPQGLCILPAQRVETSLIDSANANMVTFIVPLGVSLKSSTGAMMFLVRENLYREMFSDAIEAANDTYIFHGQELMAANARLDLPVERVLEAMGEDVPLVNTAFSHGGEDWNLLALGGRDWGMRYVTVLRASDMTSSVWQSMSGMVMILMAVASAGLLMSFLLARRDVKPIREISSMLDGPHPAGDELTSIQTGIRELSRRNTDLVTRLERSLPMQRHDFAIRFMKGRFDTREQAVASAAAVGMNIDRAYYAVILAAVQDHSEAPLDLREPPFSAIGGLTGCGVELMSLKTHLYLVFADEEGAVRRAAESIRDMCQERTGYALVALSNLHTNFAHASACYLEAATAYENRFVMGEGPLLEYAAISGSLKDILPKARKITDGINQAIALSNREMLGAKIDELLHFLKHTSMTPFAFRLIYNDVIHVLLKEHAVDLADGQDDRAMYDIFSLSGCQSVEDLDALLRRLCDAIMLAEEEPARRRRGSAQDAGISPVVAYINDHFTEPELSMSAIAEAFGMSTVRLSLAFKEATRVSPNEYLTILRVERSKELLMLTEDPIKEIAAAVGYYDASSFIRRFKQMTGLTPLQYRRSKEEGSLGNDAER